MAENSAEQALAEAQERLAEAVRRRDECDREIDRLKHLGHSLEIAMLSNPDQKTLQALYVKWFPESQTAKRFRKAAPATHCRL
jgi:hypothetical protein